MKKGYLLLPLSLLALAGCVGTPVTSSVLSSETSSSKNDVNAEEALLANLQKGYKWELTETRSDAGKQGIVEVSAGASGYRYAEYGIDAKTAKKSYFKNVHYLAENPESKALSEVSLTIGNKLSYQAYLDASGAVVTYRSSMYRNAFKGLKATSLAFDANGLWNLPKENEAYKFLSAQILPADPVVEADAIALKLDRKSGALSLSASFGNLTDAESSEAYSLTYEGSLVASGENAYEAPKPLEGEGDPTIEKAFESLKKGNYRGTSTFSKYDKDIGDFVPQNVFAFESDGETSYNIQSYSGTGTQLGENGFVVTEDGKIQAVYATESELYPDGNPMEGSLKELVPSFDISSLFFEKSEKNSTENLSYYRLREDLPDYVALPESSYYDKCAPSGSALGNLILAVGDSDDGNFVEFINETSARRIRTYYGEIGTTEAPIMASAVNENSDAALWSELLSLSATEGSDALRAIKESVRSMDVLDMLPTFGGVYANVTLSDLKGYLEIQTSPTETSCLSKESIEALEKSFVEKLKSSEYGFVDSTSEAQDGGKVYEKTEVSVTDPDTQEEKQGILTVEVAIHQDESDPTLCRLAIYPYFQEA